MSDKTILASAIADVPHFVAFDTMAKQRFSQVELEKLLVYIIDSVDSSAIPYLAAQFDVLGYKGFRLATTEQQQREMIKRAIELKRYKGTVWAVKESLKAIGYGDAKLIEHVETGPHGWATFRIELDGGSNVISAANIDELVKMIYEYKNERSHLTDISYSIDLGNDAVTVVDDSFEGPALEDADEIVSGGDFRHNGQYMRNGSKNYNTDTDVLEVEIINV